ncbi:MAG: hypothetical protein K2X49_16640 [Acetobacteraceae bacterium]|nr:hypothetical protein [Acetobacteraceae bacterium]
MPITTKTKAPDAATLKTMASRAMTDGIRILPLEDHFGFGKAESEAVRDARHLGTITYEEIEATDPPPISLHPAHWPGRNATYTLLDEDRISLIWLHLDKAGSRMRVSTFANMATGSPMLVLPMTLHANGDFLPIMTVFVPGQSALEMVENIARCGLHGGSLMLARYRATLGVRP